MKRKIIPYIVSLSVLLSCNRINIPQAEYSEHVLTGYIPVFLKYDNGLLKVNDSIIKDFTGFRQYVGDLDGFEENTRHCIIALEMDLNTPFHEIDSIFRIFSVNNFFRVFFLVNDIKDSLGFSLTIPFYHIDRPVGFEIPDTVKFENLIRLKEDTIFHNGEMLNSKDLGRTLREIAFEKEGIALLPSKNSKYEDIVLVLEKYNESRSYFKGLYSELTFNKKYDWLLEYGLYKEEVDEEFKNRLFLLNAQEYEDKTLIY